MIFYDVRRVFGAHMLLLLYTILNGERWQMG